MDNATLSLRLIYSRISISAHAYSGKLDDPATSSWYGPRVWVSFLGKESGSTMVYHYSRVIGELGLESRRTYIIVTRHNGTRCFRVP